MNENDYFKYSRKFNFIYITEMLLNFLTVVIVLCVIFMPILSCDAIFNKTISYSVIDEIKLINKSITQYESTYIGSGAFKGFRLLLFANIAVCMITLLCGTVNIVKNFIKLYSERESLYNNAYSRIKRGARVIRFDLIFNLTYSIFFYPLMSFIVCEILSSNNLSADVILAIGSGTYIVRFNGYSSSFFIVCLLFAVYIFLTVFKIIMQIELKNEIRIDERIKSNVRN